MAWYLESTAYVPAANSADWDARNTAMVRRPALFVYLDWPTGAVRATMHHKSVTIDGDVWSGVGDLGFARMAASSRGSAATVYTIGLASLPQGSITAATEAQAIGRRAILYEGLFDEAWANPVLKKIFIGHIRTAGDIKNRRIWHDDETFTWVTDASVEIGNGRHPRRQIANYHSIETAESGDTAWRHLPGVAHAKPFPA